MTSELSSSLGKLKENQAKETTNRLKIAAHVDSLTRKMKENFIEHRTLLNGLKFNTDSIRERVSSLENIHEEINVTTTKLTRSIDDIDLKKQSEYKRIK